MAEQRLNARDMQRRVRGRNWAVFAVLFGLVVLFYIMTIVRMGGVR